MDKYLIKSISIQEMNVRYFLLKEYARGQGTAYGICVETEDEQVTIRQITTKREDIEELLARLIYGSVTSVTAYDVIEDWLLR